MGKKQEFDFLDPLYLSNNIEDVNYVKRRLLRHKSLPGIYLILLSQKEDEELVLLSSTELKMLHMRDAYLPVVGIAKGYSAAEVLILKIAKEAYINTGDCHLKSYLMDKYHYSVGGKEDGHDS